MIMQTTQQLPISEFLVNLFTKKMQIKSILHIRWNGTERKYYVLFYLPALEPTSISSCHIITICSEHR